MEYLKLLAVAGLYLAILGLGILGARWIDRKRRGPRA
jgi:hypothetical protein